jgi:hypothetical protein
MTTSTNRTQPGRRGVRATAVIAAAAGTIVGVLATTTVISQGLTDVRPVTTFETQTNSLPQSADAAEHWLTPDVRRATVPCRPDAAQRWQTPDVAVADLPYTADAAEHWLTPEIAVGNLPYSADAAEHWLCAP